VCVVTGLLTRRRLDRAPGSRGSSSRWAGELVV